MSRRTWLATLTLVASCSQAPEPAQPDLLDAQPDHATRTTDAKVNEALTRSVAPPIAAGSDAEKEPNDDRAQARPLSLNVPAYGLISTLSDRTVGDQDWFVIHVPGDAPSVLSVSLEGPTDLDMVLEWMPRKQAQKRDRALIQADVIQKSPGNELLSNLRVMPGDVYLRVRAAWYKNKERLGSEAPYTLRAELLPWAENIEAEPNEQVADAILGQFERPARGTLGHLGDRDTWRIPVPTGSTNRLTLTQTGIAGVRQELSVRWDKAEGATIRARAPAGEGVVLRNIAVPDQKAPVLLVTVKALNGAAPRVPYDLMLKAEASSEHPTEAEPNDSARHANTLGFNDEMHGHLDRTHDADVFALKVTDPMSAVIRLRPPLDTKGRLKVTSPAGEVIFEGQSAASSAEVSAFGLGLNPGLWLVEVRGSPVNPRQGYALTVTGSGAETQEREPNNEITQAPLRSLPRSHPAKGWLHPAGDVDLWALQLDDAAGPSIVTFQVDAPKGAGLDVSIETREGNVLTGRKGLTAGQPGTFTHFLEPGSYILRVKGNRKASYATDPYSLRLLD